MSSISSNFNGFQIPTMNIPMPALGERAQSVAAFEEPNFKDLFQITDGMDTTLDGDLKQYFSFLEQSPCPTPVVTSIEDAQRGGFVENEMTAREHVVVHEEAERQEMEGEESSRLAHTKESLDEPHYKTSIQYRKRHKIYRDTHKAELAQRRKIYCKTHKAEITEQEKIYREKHKAEIAARQKIYRETHKAEMAEYQKRQYEMRKAEMQIKQAKETNIGSCEGINPEILTLEGLYKETYKEKIREGLLKKAAALS